jgi:pyruvate dehydrogenase E1 component alpha subunit
MPRAVCDGQDVFAVRAAMREAVDRARAEQVPTLLEVRTYRFMGHSMSDAVSGTYRSKAELDEHMKRDPIVLLRMHMQEQNELADDDLHKLDDEIKAIVQDAWDFADKSPEPPLEALFEDVLVDTTSDTPAESAEPVAAD